MEALSQVVSGQVTMCDQKALRQSKFPPKTECHHMRELYVHIHHESKKTVPLYIRS